MVSIQNILPIAKKVCNDYDLCDSCLGRLFTKQLNLQSSRILGKKIKLKLNFTSKKCFICKDLLDNLDPYVQLMLEKSTEFNFKTFSIGVILKPSIIDRDDYIRSKYKFKGIDSVKNDITKILAKKFSRQTKQKLDTLNSDITLTINTKNSFCDIRSKSLFFTAKYKKHTRGIPQKQKSCSNCTGKGCRSCDFHGIDDYESIEGYFSRFLFDKIGGTTAKFTWIGGEDKSSLVLGSGRKFFTKLQNPKKRNRQLPKKLKLNSVVFLGIQKIPEIPKHPLKFHSIIELEVNSKNKLSTIALKKLKKLVKNTVVVYEKSGKRSEKTIFSLKYEKISEKSLKLIIDAEGGLPVKRFVTGDNVNPNISVILDNPCKCKNFDFLDVLLK